MSKTNSYQHTALENLSSIGEYDNWLISKFEKYLGQNILEIGSGFGNISKKIKNRGFNITPSDSNKHFLKIIKKIDSNAFYLDVLNTKSIRKKYDTVLTMNVIEHIKDDNKAFKNIYNLLTPFGTAIILVPAHNLLYGSYDKQAGHYRRYETTDLSKKLKKAGFQITSIKLYNKFSAIGWFINSRILKRNGFPKLQLYFLKFFIPFFNLIDNSIPFNFGLSVICIAKKSYSK